MSSVKSTNPLRLNLKRVRAIMIKESQDIWKNTNILYMYILPILLTMLWKYFIPDMPRSFPLSSGLMFLVIMVGMYVPSMIIAEEKERKTIEVLLLSPATPLEVFAGKGVLTFLSIEVTAVLLMILTGTGGGKFLLILTATALSAIFAIFLGMMVGLLAENQMSTGVIGLPVYMVLLLVPQFAMMGVEIMVKIGKFLPTYYYINLLRTILDETGQGVWLSLGILAFSIVISFVLLLFLYRRKGFS